MLAGPVLKVPWATLCQTISQCLLLSLDFSSHFLSKLLYFYTQTYTEPRWEKLMLQEVDHLAQIDSQRTQIQSLETSEPKLSLSITTDLYLSPESFLSQWRNSHPLHCSRYFYGWIESTIQYRTVKWNSFVLWKKMKLCATSLTGHINQYHHLKKTFIDYCQYFFPTEINNEESIFAIKSTWHLIYVTLKWSLKKKKIALIGIINLK